MPEALQRTIAFDQAEATHELGACCTSFRPNLYSFPYSCELDVTRVARSHPSIGDWSGVAPEQQILTATPDLR